MNSRSKNKVFGINTWHLLCLLPLVLYSFYKNGIKVFISGQISMFTALQYLFIPMVIVTVSYLFEVYFFVGKKDKKDLNDVTNSFIPYANLLCYLVCGPNDKLFIIIPLIFVIDIIMKVIDGKFTINRVALFKSLLFGILVLIGAYNNSNLYEVNASMQNVSLWNAFVGMRVGEIGTISNLLVILSFIVLLFNKYYKKDIAIIAFITYIIFSLFFVLMGTLNINEVLDNTFNSGIIFAIVFVLTLSESTPILSGGRSIYAVLFGILSAIFINVYNLYIGIYFIILGLSIISPMINKLKISVYK